MRALFITCQTVVNAKYFLGIQNLPQLLLNSISLIQSFLSYKLKFPLDSFLVTKLRQSNRKWVAVSSVMRQENIGLAVKLL